MVSTMISTTIKRKYMDAILSGQKDVEYKAYNEYWCKRLHGNSSGVINFLCGQQCYKYKYTAVDVIDTPQSVSDVIKTAKCFAVHLGRRVS